MTAIAAGKYGRNPLDGQTLIPSSDTYHCAECLPIIIQSIAYQKVKVMPNKAK
jgi:hypothetical protein